MQSVRARGPSPPRAPLAQAWEQVAVELGCGLDEFLQRTDFFTYLLNFFIIPGEALYTSDLQDGQTLISRFSNM